jgi:Erv1 / Alr family
MATLSNSLRFDPDIWGPHFWFFLHTLGMSYPHHPNSVTKKKYYELMQNLPVFIPNENIGSEFSKLLDSYPITPYLDSRESLIRWIHFIHNKVNEKLEKPKISLNDFYSRYYEEYKPKNLKLKEFYRSREKIIYTFVILSATGLIVYLYNK